MTGLEAIINQITGDGQKEAQEILEKAKAQTAEAMEKAQAQAAEKSAAVLKDAERQAQDIRDRAKSSAELEQRNQMLLFKQELIRETVDAARDAMENAPDGEYFDMIFISAWPWKAGARCGWEPGTLPGCPMIFWPKCARPFPRRRSPSALSPTQ